VGRSLSPLSLDFLGFSRPNRDFSMGYAGFSLTEISLALAIGCSAGEAAKVSGMRKCRIAHTASLT
jgi:prepilin-type N-terminal cleavage/methylation domain-containing protein